MTTWFLIKFLTRPGYAEDFLRGQVRASPLTTFKDPIRDPAGRADPHEGTSGLFQPGRKGLVINGREFGLDLAEPARVQLNRLNHLHVVCLHAARTEPVDHFTDTPAGIEEFRRQIKVPELCLKLGSEAIVIRDVHEFCARMAAAAKTRGYTLVGRGPVRYYDPLDFHGWIPGNEPMFRKERQFEFQREFRFVIDTGIIGLDTLTLSVGDLSDIALRLRSDELNGKELIGGKIEFRPRSAAAPTP